MASRHLVYARRSIHLVLAVLVVALCWLVVGERQADAQGCSQCRDTVSQTSPAVQKSYRTAILILAGAATGFASTTVVILRKLR